MEKEFDFSSIFDSIITTGQVEDTAEIITGLKLKMKVLSTEEQIMAESVAMANNPNLPPDVIMKVRAVRALSDAIIEVNGVKIGDTSEERIALYRKIMALPEEVNKKINDFYMTLVDKQRKLYSDNVAQENIANFSNPQ